MPPYQPEQQVLSTLLHHALFVPLFAQQLTHVILLRSTVIAGDARGERGVTKSSDGDEWWVELRTKGKLKPPYQAPSTKTDSSFCRQLLSW